MTALVAMTRYTVAVTVTGARRAVLAAIVAGAVLFGLLGRASDTPVDGATGVVVGAFLGLMVPLACLVVGDAALGAERRSRAITFTWLSPVPFGQIVVARWMGACLLGAGAMAPAAAVAVSVAGLGTAAWAAALAVGVASLAYIAVFIFIGSTTRRAAVWSLGWVFIVDQLLGAALGGIAQLSPSWLGRQVYVGLADAPVESFRDGLPLGWGAVAQLAVITAVALALATWRLGRLKP